jgi:hypothetical protein
VKVDLVGSTFIKNGSPHATSRRPRRPLRKLRADPASGPFSASNGNLCKPTTTTITTKKGVAVKRKGRTVKLTTSAEHEDLG